MRGRYFMKPMFNRYIGVDYSGRADPTTPVPAIQVFMAQGKHEPVPVRAPIGRNWSRKGLAQWLIDQFQSDSRIIVGIDHAFSFPITYMDRYGLSTWARFLLDFVKHWPTHRQSVESYRANNRRTGTPKEFRLTDRWTSSAKSVFLFDVNGSVAKSTHAGMPWLLQIRETYGKAVHFWPFDGFAIPAAKSAITEVYPSIFRHRYPYDGRSIDAQDAYATAKWLMEMDCAGFLSRYLDPPLTQKQRKLARLEGWILGVG